jgi:hypothetical protein
MRPRTDAHNGVGEVVEVITMRAIQPGQPDMKEDEMMTPTCKVVTGTGFMCGGSLPCQYHLSGEFPAESERAKEAMNMIDMKRPIRTLKEEMQRIQRGASLAPGELRESMLASVEAHRRAIVLLEAEDAIYEAQNLVG